MKIKDIFARASGGAVGAAIALTVPHIGCLAAVTPLFVSVGAGATLAAGFTYLAGAAFLAGAGAAAWYGLRPSREACCILWGETRKVRLLKAGAVALCAFTAVAATNTAMDRLDVGARAIMLESSVKAGRSVWDAQKDLDLICTTRPP